MDAQLTIFDLLDELEAEQEPLRRLGDGPELGLTLLRPLFARGWRLHRAQAFAGGAETLFILSNGLFEVKRQGRELADVAVDLFKDAAEAFEPAARPLA